jgi:sRNA-binding protein
VRALARGVLPAADAIAIGIGKELRVLLGEETSKATLGFALRHWTGRPDYLDAVARGEVRRNLDGSPATEPTETERQHAAERLQAFEAREAEAFRRGVEAYNGRAEKARAAPAPAADKPA